MHTYLVLFQDKQIILPFVCHVHVTKQNGTVQITSLSETDFILIDSS